MQTLYFQLERSKILKDRTHPIYLVLKIKDGGREVRIRHYTGRSVLSKHWEGKGKNKRVSPKSIGATITNSRLQTLRQGADAILTNAKNLKVPITKEYFIARFKTEILGEKAETERNIQKQTFFEHLQTYIDNRKGILQPSTIKTYQTLKQSLNDFQTETGYKIDFESLNSVFNTLYTKYLIDDKGLLNNTLAKRIATLKAYLREETANQFTFYQKFKASRDSDTTLMYLTESELTALSRLKLKPDSTETHVRDAFVVACHTGLRFSDWDKLKPENIIIENDSKGNSLTVLSFTMHKVHRTVKVPLSDSVLAILKRYTERKQGKTIIPLYSNQETNLMRG